MPEILEEAEFPPWPSQQADAPEPEDTPWPGTPRAARLVTRDVDDMVAELQTQPRPTKSTDPGFWSYPRDGVQRPPRPARFDWIPDEPEVHDERPPTVEERVEQRAQRMESRQAPARAPRLDGVQLLYWSVAAVLFGGTTAGVLYALSRILG